MTPTTAAILAIALTVVLIAAGAAAHRLSQHLRPRESVAVNLRSGEVIFGVLWTRNRRYIHLKAAAILADGNQAPLDGDVTIERDNIRFVQLLDTPTPERT